MNVQEEIKSLKERIAELEEQVKEEQEFPRVGDIFYSISEIGNIESGMIWGGYPVDMDRMSIGNVFKTEDEAEFELEKLKVEAELRKLSDSWDLENTQYSFSFNWENGEFEIEYPDYNQYPNSYYFYSINSLELAIETIGKERIKKNLFGVED